VHCVNCGRIGHLVSLKPFLTCKHCFLSFTHRNTLFSRFPSQKHTVFLMKIFWSCARYASLLWPYIWKFGKMFDLRRRSHNARVSKTKNKDLSKSESECNNVQTKAGEPKRQLEPKTRLCSSLSMRQNRIVQRQRHLTLINFFVPTWTVFWAHTWNFFWAPAWIVFWAPFLNRLQNLKKN
jgi:hypothetical protein